MGLTLVFLMAKLLDYAEESWLVIKMEKHLVHSMET